jgi:simple sugar transport system permease protein
VTSSVATEAETGRRSARDVGRRLAADLVARREFGIFVVLVVLVVYFWLRNSAFVDTSNWSTLSQIAAPWLIVAIGETMLLTCGEIDLSVGHVYALAPWIMYRAWEHNIPLVLGVVLAVAVAACVGFANGAITVWLRVPSLIVTLGMFTLLNGITLLISNGSQQPTPGEGSHLANILGAGTYGPLVTPFYWAFALMLVFHFLLTQTRYGLHVVATGGNSIGARESGVNTQRVRITTFMLCSMLGGFGGILTAFNIGTTDPLAGGTSLMFYGVAASVIGGTSLMGGSGTIIGSFFGVCVLAVLNDGFTLVGTNAFYNDLFIGAAILLSMALDFGIKRLRGSPL